jgi:hypothetical protein
MMKELKTMAAMSVEYVIGMAVALLVMIAILPTVLNGFNGTTVTGWPSSVQTLWNLMPVIIIVAFVIAIVHYKRK